MTKLPPIHPLKFTPIYKEKVWGGRKLETLGRLLPGDENTAIGESWELADLGQTSASGGGGGEARSVVADGPLAGKTLHELIEQYGKQLIGDLPLADSGEFPLLVKYLDAAENLSVQVHPSATYAAEHSDASLKSEAWYVLRAQDGAAIYKGVREGVTPGQFRKAIGDNSIEQVLIKVEVEVGQCHYLPSGTCHALGAGVLVAEVQTPSDTTFRVYDWGRSGRELHVEQSMQCIDFGPAQVSQYEKDTQITGESATIRALVNCEYFRIDRIEVEAGYNAQIDYDQPVIWMVLAGGGELLCDGIEPIKFGTGHTILFPPGMSGGSATVDDQTAWLEVSFPQAESLHIA